jgi:hypothetical protein
MYRIPDTTQGDDAQDQDKLAAVDCPRLSRSLKALRKHNLAGSLCGIEAQRQMLSFGGVVNNAIPRLWSEGIIA